MTCKEILWEKHPDLSEEKIDAVIYESCPFAYHLAPKPDYCVGADEELCKKCWNREVPEKSIQDVTVLNAMRKVSDNVKMAGELLDEYTSSMQKDTRGEFVEKTMHIKDSGDRTQFETGAVRDMREGKGRCDLMPLEVVANMLEVKQKNADKPIDSIRDFLRNNNDTFHLSMALEWFAEKAYDGDFCTMFLEVAKHFEEGAKKYGENNWQKGIPVHCYIDSAVRHYLKWLRGDKDEPHDRAFVWNLMCCIWEVDYHKETSDE